MEKNSRLYVVSDIEVAESKIMPDDEEMKHVWHSLEAGENVDIHTHFTWDEHIIVTAGEFVLTVGVTAGHKELTGKAYPGHYLMATIERSHPHGFRAITATRYKVIWKKT